MHLKTSNGQSGTYEDTCVCSTSANQGKLAIYGAKRRRDGALTLMILNEAGENLISELNLSGFKPRGSAQVSRYSAANLGASYARRTKQSAPTASRPPHLGYHYKGG